jgi:hypothetical protein
MNIMDELEALFKILNPQETLTRTITKTKYELQKIKLPKLEGYKKCCKYPSDNKGMDEYHQIIIKYQTLRKNLYRIWLQTKEEEVLKPIIYMKHLRPFDEETDRINTETLISGETKQAMMLLNQEIEKLLTTYEELHTKEKDELEMFLQNLLTENEA